MKMNTSSWKIQSWVYRGGLDLFHKPHCRASPDHQATPITPGLPRVKLPQSFPQRRPFTHWPAVAINPKGVGAGRESDG